MNQKVKSLDFVLPTDEEALNALGQLFQQGACSACGRGAPPAENQIAMRLWLTDLLRDAGRMPEETAEEAVEGIIEEAAA